MLLPQMWLRKRKLESLLKDYPLYDPPHKVEERLLPKEQAQENFDYFMRVRKERSAYFVKWLRDEFDATISPDSKGVDALGKWLIKFGGLLFPSDEVYNSYFSYDPPWTGEGAGCNVVFDAGIAFGEIIIANCPMLRWEMGPVSKGLSAKDIKIAKSEFGLEFQRPEITGFDDPWAGAAPLTAVHQIAHQIRKATTFEERNKYFGKFGLSVKKLECRLSISFENILDGYINGSLLDRYKRDHGIDLKKMSLDDASDEGDNDV